MDKKIVDKLIQFGLITNVGIDANKYTDVDDLIAKGIVTVPGAKAKINELLGEIADVTPEAIEDENDDNTLVPNPESQPINEVINEVLDDKSPVINEVLDDKSPVIDETPETVESEIVVEEANDEVTETTEEPVKKTRKSKKAE